MVQNSEQGCSSIYASRQNETAIVPTQTGSRLMVPNGDFGMISFEVTLVFAVSDAGVNVSNTPRDELAIATGQWSN